MEKTLVFSALAAVLIILTVNTRVILRNWTDDIRLRHMTFSMVLCLVGLSACLFIGQGSAGLCCLNLVLLALPVDFAASSSWEGRDHTLIFTVILCMQILFDVYELLQCAGMTWLYSSSLQVILLYVTALFTGLVFIYGAYSRIMDVKLLFKDSSVLRSIGISVDAVYFISLIIMIFGAASALEKGRLLILTVIMFLLYISIYASSERISSGALFILMPRHENRILESLKMSQVEIANCVKPDAYQELYERIIAYFESERPYLKSSLTMNDVAQVVFSNKTYISKAISMCTGRNFCQFVNYYRIMYAVECFRSNPSLKVSELCSACGFNSVVSFNMAFKLYMNENPGDWCRKERYKLVRKK